MFITDSHCHLDKLDYKKQHCNLQDVISKANFNNVKFMLAVSITIENFYFLKNFIKNAKNIALSCGIHPLYTSNNCNLEDLQKASKDKSIIALGETGLDYFCNKTKHINIIQQQLFFREHIRIAIMLNKPLIIHAREASKDIISILKDENAEICGGVLHCFTETKEIANKLLDMGFYISFSGIITFHNTNELRDIVKYVPLDRILIETDSPYLAPEPYRGKENQPAYLFYIAQQIAKIKNINVQTLADITTKNFVDLFKLTINIF